MLAQSSGRGAVLVAPSSAPFSIALTERAP
jgi:hypothetical protein